MENTTNTTQETQPVAKAPKRSTTYSAFLFIVLSIVGVVSFMVNVTINGESTVPLEHISNLVYKY